MFLVNPVQVAARMPIADVWNLFALCALRRFVLIRSEHRLYDASLAYFTLIDVTWFRLPESVRNLACIMNSRWMSL